MHQKVLWIVHFVAGMVNATQVLVWTSRFHYIYGSEDSLKTAAAALYTCSFDGKMSPTLFEFHKGTEPRLPKNLIETAQPPSNNANPVPVHPGEDHCSANSINKSGLLFVCICYPVIQLHQFQYQKRHFQLLSTESPPLHWNTQVQNTCRKMWSSLCTLSINTGIFSKDMSTSHGHQ